MVIAKGGGVFKRVNWFVCLLSQGVLRGPRGFCFKRIVVCTTTYKDEERRRRQSRNTS